MLYFLEDSFDVDFSSFVFDWFALILFEDSFFEADFPDEVLLQTYEVGVV